MEIDGRIVTQDIWDGHYDWAVHAFWWLVRSGGHHLVYLWMMDDDPEIDDRVILERWVEGMKETGP
jgi:hypothetical protein